MVWGSPNAGYQQKYGGRTVDVDTKTRVSAPSGDKQRIGRLMQATGTIVGGFQGLSAARSLRNIASRESHSLIESAIDDYRQRTIGLQHLQGTQRAQYGAAGIEGGTPQAVNDFTSYEAIRERELVLAGALQTADRMRRDRRRQARAAGISGAFDIAQGAVDFAGELSSGSPG